MREGRGARGGGCVGRTATGAAPLPAVGPRPPMPPRVHLDIAVGDAPPRRVELELFDAAAPRAAANFRALCRGDAGSAPGGARLAFASSKFHRIIPG